MGGGASSVGALEFGEGLFPSSTTSFEGSPELDEMLASFQQIIGRTITALRFPGFHSLTEFAIDAEADGEEGYEDGDMPPLEVKVGSQVFRIRDVLATNDNGWNALHSCCHSTTTSDAGLAILRAYTRERGDIDAKTLRGPGTFNAGWTPLHMAAGYGVYPLVIGLLEAGADCNTTNSFTWTPLLEACHKSFVEIARVLVEYGADVNYLPNDEAATSAHFLRGPPQTPLGEACRCGSVEIAHILLEARAEINKGNQIGWTALHEAAFYNHPKLVRLLLEHGADATVKNLLGALPFHLAGSGAVRDVFKELAPEAACVPPPRGPTFVMSVDENGQLYIGQIDENSNPQIEASQSPSLPKKHPEARNKHRAQDNPEPELLHSGGILGDLPSLNKPRRAKRDSTDSTKKELSEGTTSTADSEGPEKYICQLSKRVMIDPVSTPYGNIYDKSLICLWLSKQGSIDPLTGQPLVQNQLKPVPGLKEEIALWRKRRQNSVETRKPVLQVQEYNKAPEHQTTEDELYDF